MLPTIIQDIFSTSPEIKEDYDRMSDTMKQEFIDRTILQHLKDLKEPIKIDAHKVAEYIHDTYNVYYIREEQEFYTYDSGAYKRDKLFIPTIFQNDRTLAHSRQSRSTRYNIQELLTGTCNVSLRDFDNTDTLCCTDGLYTITDTGYTIQPHTPDILHTIQRKIPPKQHTTDIPDLLHTWVGRDTSYLLMFIHLLLFDYALRRQHTDNLWFLFGPNWTGKSTFLRLTNNLLRTTTNHRLSSSLSLNVLKTSDSKEMSQLEHCICNLCDEVDISDVMDMSNLKWLTGGSEITIHRKYKDPISIEPNVVLLFSANWLPTIHEWRDDAIMRRLVPIPFVNMMELNGTGHNDDIEHRISDYDNLSGYIHYILTNKQEIIQKAQYIRPTREISRSLYLASRGMHDMWFADVMQHSSATEPIETPVLYAAYVDWAMSYGTIPITADHFFNVLKYRGWRVHVVQDVDGRRQEAVLGCTLDMPTNTPLDKFRDWLEITFRDKCNVPYIEIESAWRNTKHLYPTISNLKQCLVSYGIHNDVVPHIRGIGKHSQPDTQETL